MFLKNDREMKQKSLFSAQLCESDVAIFYIKTMICNKNVEEIENMEEKVAYFKIQCI